jgi:hypothetical protein
LQICNLQPAICIFDLPCPTPSTSTIAQPRRSAPKSWKPCFHSSVHDSATHRAPIAGGVKHAWRSMRHGSGWPGRSAPRPTRSASPRRHGVDAAVIGAWRLRATRPAVVCADRAQGRARGGPRIKRAVALWSSQSRWHR